MGDAEGDAGVQRQGALRLQFQDEAEYAADVVFVADRRPPEEQQMAAFVAEVDAVEQPAVPLLQLEKGLHELVEFVVAGRAGQLDEEVEDVAEFASEGLGGECGGEERGLLGGAEGGQVDGSRPRPGGSVQCRYLPAAV